MYKFSNAEHTAVKNLSTGVTNIRPGNWMWNVYKDWLSAGGVTEPFDTSTESDKRYVSFLELKQRIVLKRQEKNSANFIYNNHPYISDEVNIQGVRIQVDGSPDSYPIPTFVGTALESTWHTADDQFILFNAGQFREFATAYFSHREKNFTNYTMLTIAATQFYNAGASVDQLNNFDISQGWN